MSGVQGAERKPAMPLKFRAHVVAVIILPVVVVLLLHLLLFLLLFLLLIKCFAAFLPSNS